MYHDVWHHVLGLSSVSKNVSHVTLLDSFIVDLRTVPLVVPGTVLLYFIAKLPETRTVHNDIYIHSVPVQIHTKFAIYCKLVRVPGNTKQPSPVTLHIDFWC